MKRRNLVLFVFLLLAFAVYFGQAEEQKKIKVAVLPPSASGDASASVSQGLTSVIVTELSRSPSLEVSDRRDVEKALKEQAFGLSGCTDQSCQIEIGKILQSKWVVTGDLNKIGTLYILTLKILNVETSKIEYQDEEEYKGEVEGLVPKTKALTSRLADFLLTGKKPKVVKEKPKEENKKTTEQKKKQETKEVNKKKVTVVPEEEKKNYYKKTVDTSGMVYIPAGYFWMGWNQEEVNIALELCKIKNVDCSGDWFEAMLPKQKVYLDSYYIDKNEVTNEEYKKCVETSVCQKPHDADWYGHYEKPGNANHPVVLVKWQMADTYCKWAVKRLPTEAEWEKAARGKEGFYYPWGNTWCEICLNWDDHDTSNADGYKSTSPVGTFENGKSAYGVYDMAGNVWEWVVDWHDENYYKSSPSKNPEGPIKGTEKVLRGGAWYRDHPYDWLMGFRYKFYAGYYSVSLGFRCANN